MGINSCCEGLEGATINVYSGTIDITADDDCLNAANPDLTGCDYAMNICGGTITAYSAAGDGFDSNGTMTFTGGTVAVWTTSTADNEPLDADGTITVTGGTILAAGGSSGTGMTIDAQQPYVTFGESAGMGGPGGRPGAASTEATTTDMAGGPGNMGGEMRGETGGPGGERDDNFAPADGQHPGDTGREQPEKPTT